MYFGRGNGGAFVLNDLNDLDRGSERVGIRHLFAASSIDSLKKIHSVVSKEQCI